MLYKARRYPSAQRVLMRAGEQYHCDMTSFRKFRDEVDNRLIIVYN